MPEPDGRADKVSEGADDKRMAVSGRTGRTGGADTVGRIGEVQRPPGERITEEAWERGKGGASDDLRTAMDEMEVGEEEMDEGGVEEVEVDDMEAGGGGGGGLMGGCFCWNPQRS